MNSALSSFVVLSAAVLGLLSIVAAGVAVAASVLCRSALIRKELATRRALGARRSNIVRMFLSENVLGVAAGIAIGSLALLAVDSSWTVILNSANLLGMAGLLGGWIAGRHAANSPVSRSGRFRTTLDI
jgi:ABC-type antimicrobial peptide transport system permease subunit